MTIRALVMTAPGINCDLELAHAKALAQGGGKPARARAPRPPRPAPEFDIECTHNMHCPPGMYCQHRLARMGVCRHRAGPPAPAEPAVPSAPVAHCIMFSDNCFC